MGVQGLLPFLAAATDKTAHVRQFANQCVGVDGYVWLHAGAHACALELAQGRATDKFVAFFVARINMLLYHGVRPLVVFDGARLPAKRAEEEARRAGRAAARKRAAAHLAAGERAKAIELYQRAVDVTPAMARQVAVVLRRIGVPFVVAPYEADAQLAYLARTGAIDAVVTVDSDLVAYGCARVFLKMDKTGAGHLIERERLGDVLHDLDGHQLQLVCVLAGCDYMPGVKGLGVRGAFQLVRRHRTAERVVQAVLRDGNLTPPANFALLVERALLTFRHQRVWCARRESVVPLEPFADATDAATGDYADDAETRFLGPHVLPDVARGIAAAELDPMTRQPFDADTDSGWQAKQGVRKSTTLQALARKTELARQGTWTGRADDAPVQTNKLTNYAVPIAKKAKAPFKAPRKRAEADASAATPGATTAAAAASAVAATTASTAATSTAQPPQQKRRVTHVFSRFFAKQYEHVLAEQERRLEDEAGLAPSLEAEDVPDVPDCVASQTVDEQQPSDPPSNVTSACVQSSPAPFVDEHEMLRAQRDVAAAAVPVEEVADDSIGAPIPKPTRCRVKLLPASHDDVVEIVDSSDDEQQRAAATSAAATSAATTVVTTAATAAVVAAAVPPPTPPRDRRGSPSAAARALTTSGRLTLAPAAISLEAFALSAATGSPSAGGAAGDENRTRRATSRVLANVRAAKRTSGSSSVQALAHRFLQDMRDDEEP